MHGVIGMIGTNRKGRKRKSGRRTASGGLARKSVDFRSMAAAQPHRIGLPEALRTHERAASVIGCLNLRGAISDQQFEAGRLYAVAVGAYMATIGGPTLTAGEGRGYECAGARDCPADSCICRMRHARYDGAYRALAAAGRPALMAVNRTAVHDEASDIAALRMGLSALARHFGLTNHRN